MPIDINRSARSILHKRVPLGDDEIVHRQAELNDYFGKNRHEPSVTVSLAPGGFFTGR